MSALRLRKTLMSTPLLRPLPLTEISSLKLTIRCLSFSLLFSLFFAALASAETPSTPRQATVERLKLGAVLSLTGPLSSVGTAIREGMEFALREPGGEAIELLFEDDRSVERVATVTATTKLITINRVDALLVEAMSAVSAIAPIVSREQIPTVIVWDSNESLQRHSEFIYGFGFSNELAGVEMAHLAVERLHSSQIALITAQNDWSELVGQAFVARATALGGNVQFRESVAPETTDFRSIILRLKQQRVDAVYFPLWGTAMHSFIRQARALKFTGHLLTGDSFFEHDLKELGGDAEGLYVGQVWLSNRNFIEKYRAAFRRESSGVNLGYVALGYDAIRMFVELRQQLAGEGIPVNRSSIQQRLGSYRYAGVLGEIAFRKQLSDRREEILQIRNNRFEPVHESPPAIP